MRATFVIGWQEEQIEASFRTYYDGGFQGVGLDSATASSSAMGQAGTMASGGIYRGTLLGAHYVQALEWTGGGTANYRGLNSSA